MRFICDMSSMAFRATTICMVVQFGLATIRRGQNLASRAFTSGTTKGTFSSILNADELSIIMQPNRVISSANSFETSEPADTKAKFISLKSSPCLSNCTLYGLPLQLYSLPTLRSEPKSFRSSKGKLRCFNILSSSCPTAPLTPTIAIFIIYYFFVFECKITKKHSFVTPMNV